MAIDTSSVDNWEVMRARFALNDREDARTNGGEWDVQCPFPGCSSRNDALCLWPYREEGKPVFWCRKCKRGGDIVKLVELVDGVSCTEACNLLGLKKQDGGAFYVPKKPVRFNLDEPPGGTWQGSAEHFVLVSQNVLWKSEHGAPALAWLRARGFTDETIQAQGYGYNPKERFDDSADWCTRDGKKVWLPRGIVIPWWIGGALWKVNIRRGEKDVAKGVAKGEKPRKYINVKDGSNGLYHADMIRPGGPLVLLEGEFNADILLQALAMVGIDNIAVIATGSTEKGRADNWLVKIAQATPLLLSFDSDNGGEQAIKEYWAKVLPHGLPWPAIGGDVNDMHLAGGDLAGWVRHGLKLAKALNAPECDDKTMVCARCCVRDDGELDFRFEETELAYCSDACQFPEPEPVPEPVPARVFSSPYEAAEAFSDAFPSWSVEVVPTAQAYTLPGSSRTLDPEAFWRKLERKLGPKFKIPSTPRSAYWHLKGYEDEPVPSLYRDHAS